MLYPHMIHTADCDLDLGNRGENMFVKSAGDFPNSPRCKFHGQGACGGFATMK